MRLALLCFLALVLASCATTPSPTSDAVLKYATGEYSPDYSSRFSTLYVTHDFRFVLFLLDHDHQVRTTGRVATGPVAASGYGPQWIDLTPDPAFAGLSIPLRLYLTQRDSYQCLATQPSAPKFWRGGPPAGYDYFCDSTSEGSPAYFKDVPQTDIPSPNNALQTCG
jgi:hypothetical protein